jgi:hypothetical protein
MQLLVVPVRVCRLFFKISCARHSNYQSPGEYINRPSQIYFDGKLTNNDFDINMVNSLQKANGKFKNKMRSIRNKK